MQTIPQDTYSGQANESNVMYQMRASDVIVHPTTLPIGAQSNSSLVSTPVADYANQPPQFAAAVITNEMHSDAAQMQQSMSTLTYSEVIKLNPIPQAQGKSHTVCDFAAGGFLLLLHTVLIVLAVQNIRTTR